MHRLWLSRPASVAISRGTVCSAAQSLSVNALTYGILQVVSRHNTVEQDAAPDRMIVVARGKEDVSYLSIFLPDIPHTVYQVRPDYGRTS